MFELSIFSDDTLRTNAAIYQCEPWYDNWPCDEQSDSPFVN
jgi:hypothetical protein